MEENNIQPDWPLEAPLEPEPKPQAAPRYRARPYHVHAALLPLVFLIGLGAGYLIWDRSAKTPASPADATAAAAQKTAKRYNIPLGDDPSLGPQNAPVTFVIFSDYQCPYCRKWYSDVFKSLVSDYKNKIHFVYKDFPLYSLHENAEAAAESARCAGEQGKYWEYQDLLFTSDQGLGSAALAGYARSLKLDTASFDNCVSTHKYQNKVDADYQFAANLGVQSTPTFFINGLAMVGAQPLEVFKQVIDNELASAGK